MNPEEMERRIFALEMFVFNIGQMLYYTLPPEMQENLEEIRQQWSVDRRCPEENAPEG